MLINEGINTLNVQLQEVAIAKLTFSPLTVEEVVFYLQPYPKYHFTVTNNNDVPIAGRTLSAFMRYISQTPLEHIRSTSLAVPLTVYDVPQSAGYPSFNLAPGASQQVDFAATLPYPRDALLKEFWIQDDVTGDKSNVVTL